MTRIRLYDHPFAPVAPLIFEASSLVEWLLDRYGEAPTVNVQIFAGEPCAENEISFDAAAIMRCDRDEYVVLQSPGGPVWVVYVVMAVFAVAAYLLAPKPVMPGNVNRTQQSPNNALANRENQVRLLQRVEDIYGTVKSIPSLMMPTYVKYIEHRKFEFGYYCIGRGYYDLADLRDGDTLISDIDGARASVYAPFTSPNSGDGPQLQIGDAIIDDVLTAARAIEVDGVVLKALNQVQLPAGVIYTFTPHVGGDKIAQGAKQPNFSAIAEVGDTITISTAPFYETANSGVDYDGSLVGNVNVSGPYNYTGSRTIAAVGDGEITLVGASFAVAKTMVCTIAVSGRTEYTDWVTLPATDRTEVWINIVAVNGMFKDDGGKTVASVDVSIEIEKLDASFEPLGVVETVGATLAGVVSDERADTVEHATAWIGPARVRMRRTTAFDYAFKGTVVDEVKWADLYSVSPVAQTQFGNKTTVHTVTQATARATAVKTRQLNCIASRKLPNYDGAAFSGAFDAAGRHVSGTIAATSKLADIIAAVSVDAKIGARDLGAEVDMAQIWGVQQQLDAWSTECGQFNYTFDSDNTSFEETVVTIANAGFCIAYRQNGKIRLALDRAQPSSTALFTHRNKKPNAETITRKFASDAEYDGVEFVYVDPDSNQSETITLPLDGGYTKLKKFEIAGIRSFDQAWLRANREYQKLKSQRVTIETTTTLDARALLPNSRIDVVDNTRFKSYDGEIVGQSGLELILSRDIAFTSGLPHSIVLMRRDGTLQSIGVLPGAAPNRVVLQSLPSEPVVTMYGADGIRTIFSFAADSARGAQAYLVQEIDISDGQYVTIKAINYSAAYFSYDQAAIPAKETIIN